ncbi:MULTISPECIES: Fe-S cluster assembly sulfur transfer protein SufU [Herpetosiphon]|uniref:Fe-S cluster assembly sulfur transfer protein SufU n=1 Tax=Herpetosiphon TaxID=64 RepID=UPI000D7BD296|nr:SUF system NifU family Fe-S cluster assembly protein [Herpetosiphon llansteffanensis]MBM7843718.1 nitrogen fixation NifU-like protein [Herpetosiphon giganteus]
MDDLYRENILDHYRHPRNYGELEQATIVQHEHNPLCGDQLSIYLLVENERIVDVKFKGKGCAISQASASMLSEELTGKSVDEAKAFDKQTILDLLGIPIGPVRLKCALLSLKTLKAGLYGVNLVDDDEDSL